MLICIELCYIYIYIIYIHQQTHIMAEISSRHCEPIYEFIPKLLKSLAGFGRRWQQ